MTLLSLILIASIFLLNTYLYKKNIYQKKMYLITTILISLYIITSIVIYYNNINKGFNLGVLYGDILGEYHFCDEYKYLMDKDILYNHIKNGDLNLWLSKQLPSFEFIDSSNHPSFGNYNFYVIVLTLLKFLGFKTALDFILLKLFIFIPTAILLFKLSRLYLSEKLSYIVVIIFSLLPGYILTNSLLMRDNIIIFLIIATFYQILSKRFKFYYLIPLAILLILFRSYVLLTLIATFIFTFKNNKKLVSIMDILFFTIMIGTIYFFINFNFTPEHSNMFFSFYQIVALQDLFRNTYGTGIPMLINLFYSTALHIFIDPLYLNFLTSGLLYLVLTTLGNIIGIIFSFAFIPSFIYLSYKTLKDNLIPKYIYLLKFTFYFTILNALIIMAKDTFIINRLALMWMPLFIIIIIKSYSYLIAYKKNKN